MFFDPMNQGQFQKSSDVMITIDAKLLRVLADGVEPRDVVGPVELLADVETVDGRFQEPAFMVPRVMA